jgi:hypothetical protein
MADHQFSKEEGLAPLRFGMEREQVIEILGEPKKQYRFDKESTSSEELDSILNSAGVSGATGHLAELYRSQLIDNYNDGELDNWNGGGPLSFVSSVTYFEGTVSKITSLDCQDRIFFGGVEISAKDLFGTIRALHALSEEMYVDGDYLYFDELGIMLTLDPKQQRFVAVTDGRTEEALFEAEEYVFFEKEELEEFIAGEQ